MFGSIALLLGIVALVVLTGLSIYKQSPLLPLRRTVRFAALGLLGILLASGVLQWGIRWAPLFALLCVLCTISLAGWLLHRPQKAFRTGRALLRTAGLAVLLVVFTFPAILFPQYKPLPVTGSYTVANANYSYTDPDRPDPYYTDGTPRTVNAKFWYPQNGTGTYPLIVFSHGFCGVPDSNNSMFTDLASHGYVVCSVGHPSQSAFTVSESGKVTVLNGDYMAEYGKLGDDPAANLALFQKWMKIRVADMQLVLDSVLASSGGLYDLVDHSKIGVIGHSLGGAAAMGVPRVRSDISAVVNLDAPMMCELTGVENGRYTINPTPYPAPLLNVYSDYLYENGILANDEEYFENRLVSATAPASFEVVFRGAQHLSLTDLALVSPMLADALDGGRKATINEYDCLTKLNHIVLRFFDCYLKGDGPFTLAGIY